MPVELTSPLGVVVVASDDVVPALLGAGYVHADEAREAAPGQKADKASRKATTRQRGTSK